MMILTKKYTAKQILVRGAEMELRWHEAVIHKEFELWVQRRKKHKAYDPLTPEQKMEHIVRIRDHRKCLPECRKALKMANELKD